jgi:hypothetical protein
MKIRPLSTLALAATYLIRDNVPARFRLPPAPRRSITEQRQAVEAALTKRERRAERNRRLSNRA